jgi:hypothetical protein
VGGLFVRLDKSGTEHLLAVLKKAIARVSSFQDSPVLNGENLAIGDIFRFSSLSCPSAHCIAAVATDAARAWIRNATHAIADAARRVRMACRIIWCLIHNSNQGATPPPPGSVEHKPQDLKGYFCGNRQFFEARIIPEKSQSLSLT